MNSTNSLPEQVVSKIINHYRLDTALSSPLPLHGGWINQSFKLDTLSNAYVIRKCPPISWQVSDLQVSETIAEAFSTCVNSLVALTVNHQSLFNIDGTRYMIFPYLKGSHLKNNQVTLSHVIQVSHTLGIMHKENINVKKANQAFMLAVDFVSIEKIAHQLKRFSEEIEHYFLKKLPLLQLIFDEHTECSNFLNHDLIISHRDLSRGNILWHDNRHHIIDWELAGKINWAYELILTAIAWSIDDDGQVNPVFFKAFIVHYLDDTNNFIASKDINSALLAVMAMDIHFVTYQIQRMHHSSTDSHTFKQGMKSITRLMHRVTNLYDQKDKLCNVL